MPISNRITSKSFKDISFSFTPHPVTNDLLVVKNEDAIKTSIKNCVFTLPGEKFFNAQFGSPIRDTLFNSIDDATASVVADTIKNTIQLYETRVSNVSVEVESRPDLNAFGVTIFYDIIGDLSSAQAISFILEATR